MTLDDIRLTPEEAASFERKEFDEMNEDRFGGALELTEEDGIIVIKLPKDLAPEDIDAAHFLIAASYSGGRM